MMLSLLKYAKKYQKQIILGPFFKFLEACFELVLPLFMAQLIDRGINQNDFDFVLQMGGWMFAISMIGLICVIICQYYASIASQGFGTELRNQLMRKINQLSHAELNSLGTDTLVTRLTNDINQLQLALAMFIRLVIRAPFLSIGSIIMAFYINSDMGILFLTLLPIFCVILYLIIKKTVPIYKQVQTKLDLLSLKISQNLSGVRVIRAFVQKEHQQKQVNQVTDDLSKTYLRVTNLSSLLNPATTLVMNLGIIVLLSIGGMKVEIGTLQQGEILALINYMNQMLLALIVVANLVIIFTRAAASASRINEVFAIVPSIHLRPRDDIDTRTRDNIVFQQVSFRYQPTAGLALKNLSMTIPENSFLGIIGPTGSGKSTLTQLIPRFYDVTEGNIFINQQNVRDWPVEKLRQTVAIVPQKAVLFSGTIRENLQWGRQAATEEDCWQALEIAQCKTFVEKLEHGLETFVFEGGKNFSGGQRQRLTIARALIKKPTILILDDSLSALDYQTDIKLRKALKKALTTTTLIVVSQRVSSIQQADQILVLNNGYQVGLGSHNQLLRQSKDYQEIVNSQEEVIST